MQMHRTRARVLAMIVACGACGGSNDRAPGAGGLVDSSVATQTSAADSIATPTVAHAVRINGLSLDDDEVEQAERAYRLRIPDADYWYDPILGAWGVIGSPILGFIAPGLRLGGPLPPDASGKGTNIFVNGRELHRLDVAALQSVTGPIAPGRYFITADGVAGFEGGEAEFNIAVLTSQSASGRGSWQSRTIGAGGVVDATTSAVFLPNGGIVSTGG